jgi:hypothetical protein
MNLKFLLLLFLFITYIPDALASMDGLNGSEGYALLAIFASAFLAGKLASRIKIDWVGKFLIFVLIFVLCSGFGIFGVQDVYKRKVAQHEAVRAAREAAFQADPLKIAACSRDFSALKARLSFPLNESDKINIARIVIECSISADKLEPMAFDILMPQLVAGQWGEASTDKITFYPRYCEVLRKLHQDRNVEFLMLLVQVGRPLDCERLPDREPVWWAGIESQSRPRGRILDLPAEQAQTFKWLEFIQAHGVKISARFIASSNSGGEFNDTILSDIIQRSNAMIIMLALNAGCAPHLSVITSGPNHFWQERIKSQRSGSNKDYAIQLTNEEIDLIDAKMKSF